jgi:hypothetical protein
MATITTSVIAAINVQKDGRRWVRELHTDLVSLVHERNYLAGALDDLNIALAAYAVQLGIDIGNAEITNNVAQVSTIGSLASPTFIYSTVAQNVAALRAAYLVATQAQAIMMGDYLSSLTDVQLENAFGLTQIQVTTLRINKLTPAAASAATLRAATGA